jgi:nucleotide-binding universal stress UspA family protein
MYRHILIATDGSALAQGAVSHGLSLAKSVGAKVTVLIVEVPLSVHEAAKPHMRQMSDALAPHAELMRKHSAQELQRAADEASAIGVPCETVKLEHSHPYQAIIAAAEERGCDLIVMASHGRSGVASVVLGSVTNKVLTHTSIPVLVWR